MPIAIVAKFVCQSVAIHRYSPKADKHEIVQLQAVTGDENKPWSKFTPSGQLTMTIDNPSAQGQLEPGRAYKITIEPMPDDE